MDVGQKTMPKANVLLVTWMNEHGPGEWTGWPTALMRMFWDWMFSLGAPAAPCEWRISPLEGWSSYPWPWRPAAGSLESEGFLNERYLGVSVGTNRSNKTSSHAPGFFIIPKGLLIQKRQMWPTTPPPGLCPRHTLQFAVYSFSVQNMRFYQIYSHYRSSYWWV